MPSASRRKAWIAAGLCPSCGARPLPPEPLKQCDHCRALNRQGKYKKRTDQEYVFYERLLVCGVAPDEATRLAKGFTTDEQACACCGVPQHFIRRLHTEGKSMKGGSRHWQRLHVDHIEQFPRDDPANMRLLCYHCNHMRREGIFTDDEVLEAAWHFWRSRFPDRELKWLKEPKSRTS